MKTKLIQPKESEIQKSIIEYLRLKGWYVQRLNSGMAHIKTGLDKSRWIRLSEAGTPDILAFHACGCCVNESAVDLYFIEVKRPGKNPTPIQIAKMEELKAYGSKCLVVHSLTELQQEGL